MAERVRWTREQTIVALYLYCKIPFNRVSSTHPDIIKIAKIIGRSPNSVKMKIGNFGSFDTELKKRGIVGLANASELDQLVWDEFNSDWNNLAYESELLIAKFIDPKAENVDLGNLDDFPIGKEREANIKQRINQNFFRSTILASYNIRCCITGMSIPELLVASHIVPWSKDEKNRLNPHNGLCLNSIHDKAFDKGFITITTDYRVKLSGHLVDALKEKEYADWFLNYDNQPIVLPDKFLPSLEFLDYHTNEIFKF